MVVLTCLSSHLKIAFLVIAGVAFLREVQEGTYDAIIVDSSDPVGRLQVSSIFGFFLYNQLMNLDCNCQPLHL